MCHQEYHDYHQVLRSTVHVEIGSQGQRCPEYRREPNVGPTTGLVHYAYGVHVGRLINSNGLPRHIDRLLNVDDNLIAKRIEFVEPRTSRLVNTLYRISKRCTEQS